MRQKCRSGDGTAAAFPASMKQPPGSESSRSRLDQDPRVEGIADASGQNLHVQLNGMVPLLPASISGVAASPDAPAGDGTRQRRILLVEDDPDTRACMSALLELEGYLVVTAADGREALQQLRSGLNPGLIVLDLMMPVMDGFEFRKEQRHDPGLCGIPVVVYSGHHDAPANVAVLEPAAYVQKPINFDSFLDTVSAHCRQVPTPVAAAAPAAAAVTAPR